MIRRKRGEPEPATVPAAKVGFHDDMTPAEAARLVALHVELAAAEHRAGSAPGNEQYRQELLSIKRELGID